MFKKISQWAAAPTYTEDQERSRAALLLNMVLWMFIGAASLYGIFAPIDPQYILRRSVIIFPFLIMLLALKQILNRGYIQAVGKMTVFFMWALFTAAMYFGADYDNPAFMGYLLVVVTAGLILSSHAAIAWGLFSILTTATIILLGHEGYLSPTKGDTPAFAFWIAQTVYIIITTVLLSQATRKIDDAFAQATHEINERKRVEAEREVFINELESKNAELERFTYTVSHDLKSPLITISGYLGFLEKDAHSGQMEKFNKDLLRIREAAQKMQALLNDLLELSRVGRLMNPPEDVGFTQIVQEALAIVDISLSEKNIKVHVQKDMPKVYVDRARLVEVLQNLLDNAAKFMGNQSEPFIEIGMNSENNTRVFYVKDNGKGIDIAHHERVFGLFNKLDPQSDGTGIGLALVKRTIEVHGGTIWIDSREGKGATFYFTLPRKDS